MLLKPSDLSNAAYDCHIIMETLKGEPVLILKFSDELVRYTEVLNLVSLLPEKKRLTSARSIVVAFLSRPEGV